ncbi:hypothetical protein EYF80_057665 [Liparis tanakae]|uniref:Uncharacterized protein n=1 Tax=Liparis tanakae TaxID=230148 RepID=A0A4Z2ETC6_9TELE|nr:hypothetical protein EYF80_057665 [Liparis tanakae]
MPPHTHPPEGIGLLPPASATHHLARPALDCGPVEWSVESNTTSVVDEVLHLNPDALFLLILKLLHTGAKCLPPALFCVERHSTRGFRAAEINQNNHDLLHESGKKKTLTNVVKIRFSFSTEGEGGRG